MMVLFKTLLVLALSLGTSKAFQGPAFHRRPAVPLSMAQGTFERSSSKRSSPDLVKAVSTAKSSLGKISQDADVLASAVGGGIMGFSAHWALMGGADSSIPPETVAALAAAAAVLASSQTENETVSRVTRVLLGKPVQIAGLSVLKAGQDLAGMLVRRIQALPQQISAAAKRQATAAVENIKSLPARMIRMLQQQAVDQAKKMEHQVQTAPQRLAEWLQLQWEQAAQQVVQAPEEWRLELVKKFDQMAMPATSKTFKPRPPNTPPPLP